MKAAFIGERITELRLKKEVSEYKMSYDLGHNKNYIRAITSGRSLPSVKELFAIIDYFEMTPVEFFDTEYWNH
jgi:transcriptional regulator with XRE-family HTH domain